VTTTETELEALEASALEHLAAEEGLVEADLDSAGGQVPEDEELETAEQPIRLAIAVALPSLAAAIMVGGVFTGVGARIYASVAALLGVALALVLSRLFSRPLLAYVLMVVGLFSIGLLMVVPSGLNNVTAVGNLASEATKSGNVLRPPVPLTPGWQAIIGWLLGVVGFGAAWLAIVVRRPAVALLVPLPVAAIAAISLPSYAQKPSGIVAVVLFALGLGILSSVSSEDAEGERPPIGYEVRRALRALPLIGAITVALVLLAQANILFPDPRIDPTQEPQKPRTVPLSAVEDRVLFEVESQATGPWRVGSLDVYDGKDWRLPPFADNQLKDVPRTGVVDESLAPGVRAKFTVKGLGGAVLPALPNTVGIVAEGPRLAYDSRNGNIRLSQGQIQAGLQYTVVAATLPSEDDLRAVNPSVPADVRQFLRVPKAPPAVQDLLDQAPKTSKWDTFNFLRNYVLDNVTATGPGRPVAIPPSRVQEMLVGTREGSPFEIVAAQALLARWAGVPSRIGYGFDGGEEIAGHLEVRPKHGSTFVEVYFPSYKWLPVIGTPKQAKPTVGSKPDEQQVDPNIVPTDDLVVELLLPVLTPAKSTFTEQLQRIVLIGVPLVLLLLLLYTLYPAVVKTIVRARRRSAAEAGGPRARIALAYAEWRDLATDYGYRYTTDTPLMFLDRFADDPDHTELAWLVTRALWGDLQHDLTPELATAADELSRSLRRRLASAHPATVRAVALVSRLSLRDPFAPDLNLALKERPRDEEKEDSRVEAAVR
jgi:hypothetical protein